MRTALILGALLLVLVPTVLTEDVDSCRFAASTPYLSSEVSLCLRGAYTAGGYDGDSLIASAIAAASQYLLIGTAANSDVTQGLEALMDTYPAGIVTPFNMSHEKKSEEGPCNCGIHDAWEDPGCPRHPKEPDGNREYEDYDDRASSSYTGHKTFSDLEARRKE
ncbi:hypothetical protein KIPB_006429 [Kipferlia bialata]|uniref:Uncharacterized protein n=1 Tax=Kipferlia bialata TaxID=797122 RepID=A0A9K3GJR2_9EUKA|nr:hypothetical protein KIPB_006429 [Kipferlia bialata]|eukprot:g6429.t1